MRKLAELSAEEFFDAFLCVCPLLPLLETVDLGSLTADGQTSGQKGIAFVTMVVTKFIPHLVSHKYRTCVWELIAILDGVTPETVKTYPSPKLVYKIRKIFSDESFMDFLSYADGSDIGA